jgi:hypothetical protein
MTIEPILTGYIVFVTASAAIDSLPEPNTTSTKRYRWLYGFLHSLVGNLSRVIAARYPILNGLPQGMTAGVAIEHKETLTTTVAAPQ